MINFKKGPALSLHQVNYVAPVDIAVEAGMVVRIDSATGKVALGTAGSTNAVWGFAINSSTSGDVIEAGKLGVYALDGMTVLETDQYVTANTFTPGVSVYPDGTGKLTTTAGSERVIGQVVENVHTLENKKTATGANGIYNFQTSVNVIAIKLAI
jgi:hypothetical protein